MSKVNEKFPSKIIEDIDGNIRRIDGGSAAVQRDALHLVHDMIKTTINENNRGTDACSRKSLALDSASVLETLASESTTQLAQILVRKLAVKRRQNVSRTETWLLFVNSR